MSGSAAPRLACGRAAPAPYVPGPARAGPAAGRAGFVYLDEHGERLTDADAQRCKDLVIPPAWQDVWISPYANGHLQAVGTDEAGRRQYLYHPDWRSRRDAEKFDRVLDFGKALSRARERVLDRPRHRGDVAGARVRRRRTPARPRLLPDRQRRLRRQQRQLRADHAGAPARAPGSGDRLVFAFVGKSGIEHDIEIDDPAVVEALDVMRRRRGGGDELLAWKDGRSLARSTPATSTTTCASRPGWRPPPRTSAPGTPPCSPPSRWPRRDEPGETKASRKRAVAGAMKEVAEFLGNTPALARSSYVDPRVVDAYE